MPVERGSKILADELIDYMELRPYNRTYSQHITGKFFTPTDKSFSHKEWVRSDPGIYKYADWDIGTTYATDDKVIHDQDAWQSLIDGNTGNSPVEGSFWTKIWDNTTYTTERVWTTTPPDPSNFQRQFARILAGSQVNNRHGEKVFDFVPYAGGTSFNPGDIVYDAGTDTYYIGLSEANLGNPITDTAHWSPFIVNRSDGVWGNFKFQHGANIFSASMFRTYIYRVVWNGAGEEVKVPVYNIQANTATKETTVAYGVLEPGYYSVEGSHRASAGYGDSWVYLNYRRGDNTYSKDDQIRVMATTYEGLDPFGATELTAVLASDNRYSHKDYKGGNSPFWGGD